MHSTTKIQVVSVSYAELAGYINKNGKNTSVFLKSLVQQAKSAEKHKFILSQQGYFLLESF